MRNLKRAICFLVIMTMIFGFVVHSSADAGSTITLNLQTTGGSDISSVAIGEVFNVVVEVKEVTDCNGIQVAVGFDPTKVQVVNSTDNPVSDGAQTLANNNLLGLTKGDAAWGGTLIANSTTPYVNNTHGLVKYSQLNLSATTIPTAPIQKLVTIRLKAIATGSPNIHFAVHADGDNKHDHSAELGYIVESSTLGTVTCALVEPTSFNIVGTSPTFQSASTNTDGTIITATFSKSIANTAGKHAQFSFSDGGARTFSAVAANADPTKIDLTVNGAPIATGATVTLGYTAGNVYATDTGILATFTGQAVTNNVPSVVPTEIATGGSFTDTDLQVNQLSGTIAWTAANPTTGITGYKIYWGSDETTILAGTPDVQYTITNPATASQVVSGDTALAAGASHYLIFSYNGLGNSATCLAIAITDKVVPTVLPTGGSFTDTDLDLNQLTGTIAWTASAPTTGITGYKIYWGSNATTILAGTPGVQYTIIDPTTQSQAVAGSTALATGATHYLIYSYNADGNSITPLAIPITDAAIPTVLPTGGSFTDTDMQVDELSGTIAWTAASPTTGITGYKIYWGSNTTTILAGTPDIQYTVANPATASQAVGADTALAVGATHYLIYSYNEDGESLTPLAIAITDKVVPTVLPTGGSFTDSDMDLNQLTGTIGWTAAAPTIGITGYKIYWGSNATTILAGTPGVQYTITDPTTQSQAVAGSTALATGATYYLVYSYNGDGNSITALAIPITDAAIPTVLPTGGSFTDADLQENEVSGTIAWTPASPTTGITGYKIYWGSNATTILAGTPGIQYTIANPATASQIVAGDSALAVGATHYLIYSYNGDGNSLTPLAIAITDKKVPTVLPTGGSFTDADMQANQVSGTIDWTAASPTTGITGYKIYWGSDTTTILAGTPGIQYTVANPATASQVVSADTSLAAGATHYLIYSYNGDGNSLTPLAIAITDKVVPTVLPTSGSFTDADMQVDELSGTIGWTASAPTTGITGYKIYWGSNTTTILAGTPAVQYTVTDPTTQSQVVAGNTTLATGATHYLIYSYNGDGNSLTPLAIAITDKKVPTVLPTGGSFTDTDMQEDELTGTIAWTAASPTTGITGYKIYWGSDTTTILAGTPGVQYTVANPATSSQAVVGDTALAVGATHYLIYSYNGDGDSLTPLAIAITDKIVPTVLPTGGSFTDADMDATQLSGTIGWTAASPTTGITGYKIYWGSDTTTILAGTPAVQYTVVGAGTASQVVVADTALATGATHYLIYSYNGDGNSLTPLAIAITDKITPTVLPTVGSFTDADLDSNQLSGTIAWTAASPTTGITGYKIYWGSDATTILAGTSAVQYTIADPTTQSQVVGGNTALAAGATHYLIYSYNADGNSTTPLAVAIIDAGIPTVLPTVGSFTDADMQANQLSGTIAWTAANPTTGITGYKIYWGSDTTTILAGTSTVQYTVTNPATASQVVVADTALAAGATHYLIYSYNGYGNSTTPLAIAVTDKVVPTVLPTGGSFTDADLQVNQVSGTIAWTAASPTTGITGYKIYWGSDATTILAGTPAAQYTIADPATVSQVVVADTALAAGATHYLIYSYNGDGNSLTPLVIAITDMAVPAVLPTGGSFTDEDLQANQLSGTIAWTAASPTTGITGYKIYWGSDSTTILAGTPSAQYTIANPATASQVVVADTALAAEATHYLIFSYNGDGNSITPLAVAITDKAVPTVLPTVGSFTDTDAEANELTGTIAWTAASPTTGITGYKIYWGSNATTILAGTPAVQYTITNPATATSSVSANTALAAGATHYLIYSYNADGNSITPLAIPITDVIVRYTLANSSVTTTNGLRTTTVTTTMGVATTLTDARLLIVGNRTGGGQTAWVVDLGTDGDGVTTDIAVTTNSFTTIDVYLIEGQVNWTTPFAGAKADVLTITT